MIILLTTQFIDAFYANLGNKFIGADDATYLLVQVMPFSATQFIGVGDATFGNTLIAVIPVLETHLKVSLIPLFATQS